jgi:hypothetical protein
MTTVRLVLGWWCAAGVVLAGMWSAVLTVDKNT